MDFIQTTNKQVDKFGSGKHGFSAGNPTGGVLATLLSNLWCDGVQQELVNVIEAGGIAPAAGTLNQLLTALRSAGVFQTQPTNDSTTKAATTAFANPGASVAANGYVKLPSGVIIQWAGASIASLSTITFPIAFPGACFKVFPATIDALVYCYTSSFTLTGAVIGHNKGSAGTIYILAIGN